MYARERAAYMCVYVFICFSDLSKTFSVSLRHLNTSFSAVGHFWEGLRGVDQDQQSSRFQTSHSIFC